MSVLPIVSVLEYMNLNDLSGVLTAFDQEIKTFEQVECEEYINNLERFCKILPRYKFAFSRASL